MYFSYMHRELVMYYLVSLYWGIQTRESIDNNNCETELNKPETIRDCICGEDWVWQWTECEDDGSAAYYTNPYDCLDINNCGSEYNKPEKIECEYDNKTGEWILIESACIPKWNISEWSECAANYTLKEIAEGKKIFEGIQERLWQDLKDKQA